MRGLVVIVALAGCDDVRRAHTNITDGGEGRLACGTTVCDPTRGSICAGGQTLRTYTTTCDGETCAYRPTDIDCGVLGCCGDHCCTLAPVVTR